MNTLKIQIKPFYKNNPFHLKDDQIHILSTNKNELYYYNDFDDYEDEIEFASKNWIKMIKNK